MSYELRRIEVGPWPMNCYLIECTATDEAAIVDPGADAERILSEVDPARVRWILLTHGHADHAGGLEAVREATAAPVGIHPADAQAFGLRADFALEIGKLALGDGELAISHVPGHTPGSVCIGLNGRVIVGDTIFPGGPGHTVSPEALTQSMESLERTVFAWPDATELYPGHGGHTTVGAERGAFRQFVTAPRPDNLCGDVTWG